MLRGRLAAALGALGGWCAALLLTAAVLAAAGVDGGDPDGLGARALALLQRLAAALGGEQAAAPDSLEALLARGLAALAYLLAGRLAALVVGPLRRPPPRAPRPTPRPTPRGGPPSSSTPA